MRLAGRARTAPRPRRAAPARRRGTSSRRAPQRLRLRQLLEAEQAAVEGARRLLAAGAARRPARGRSRGSSLADGLPSISVATAPPPLEDTLVSGYARLASDAPHRRIDLELRVLDVVLRGALRPARSPDRARDRADRARDERPAGPLPRRARRPPRAASSTMLKFRTMKPGAEERIGQYLGEELVTRHRRRADAARPLAEGVAARRDPTALERAARRHVVRRPAADPAALLRRARAGPAGVLAAARRPPGPDRASRRCGAATRRRWPRSSRTTSSGSPTARCGSTSARSS